MRRNVAGVLALVAILAAIAVYAQQTAEVTGTIPARFVQVYTEKQQAQGYSVSLIRDTKTGSGNACIMIIQSLILSGTTAIEMPATACQ